MIYESRRNNLTKTPDVFELAHGTLRRNELSFPLSAITGVRIHKRFDGYLFAIITADHGTISIGSASAGGFGKPIENRKAQVVTFLTELLTGAPADCRIEVGSTAWRRTGYFLVGLVGLAVVLLVVLGLVLVLGVGSHQRSPPKSFPWLKLALLPVAGWVGWRMVRLGGQRELTLEEARRYLAEV